MLPSSNQPGTCGSPSYTLSAANRIIDTGFLHDAAGNMIHDVTHAYTFDAENHITTVDGTGATYVYDASGQRIRKTTGGVTTDYVYDASGSVVAEIQGTTWTKGYAYAGGKMVAQYNGALNASGATTLFAHADHLGSTRVMTTVAAGVSDSMDYLPYGELLGSGSSTTHKFTGKERDAESGLDDFEARYYSNALGRFMSPDPTILSVTLSNPQTWNRYTYVLNNPLNLTDPNGKWTTGEHNQIIDHVFSDISDADRAILKAASAEVDKDQSLAGSYKHAMSMPGEDPFAASQKAGEWVDDNLDKAVNAQLQWESQGNSSDNNAPDALQFFGYALHTVTDNTSPEHAGFQEWHGTGPDADAWGPAMPGSSAINVGRAGVHVAHEWFNGVWPYGNSEAGRGNAEYQARILWTMYQNRLKQARQARASGPVGGTSPHGKKKKKKKDGA